ncbi:conserved hypothetical protein [Candidatus Sulfopaludibacter sp. SbA3]|nr:conserved hypothetical protein [Candidatus Sulfopaludibacter sp. SbA3]
MTPSMQTLMQFVGLQPNLFAANSRYLGLDTATLTNADGTTVPYIKRRFLPQPGQLAQVQTYTVVQGDRLDVIAGRYFGDADLFWRICDANGAMRPSDLTCTPGQVLRICMPAGIPGAPNVP